MDKKTFYSSRDIAEGYGDRVAGGKGGEYFDLQEKEIVSKLLTTKGRILDVACGTGRFSRFMAQNGQDVASIDYSIEMLRQAKSKADLNFIRGDAFNLPFKDSAFDGVIAMHFVYHYPKKDLSKILKEMSRVAKNGGIIVFDTNRYSLRSILLIYKKEKAGVFIHKPGDIEEVARNLNFEILDKQDHFLFSQLFYRYSPGFLLPLIKKLEKLSPNGLSLKTFWKFKKPERPRIIE